MTYDRIINQVKHKRLINYSFILLFFIISNTKASPLYPCNAGTIKTDLVELGLDPEIKLNHQLMSALKIEYGDKLISILINMHPVLAQSPNISISSDTIQWVVDVIWSPENPTANYIPILIDLNNELIVDQYIGIVFDGLLNNSSKMKLVFVNQEQFVIFKTRVNSNLKEIISNRHPDMTAETLKRGLSAFNDHYLSDDGYNVTFEGINHKEPIVSIYGHGRAGHDYIKVGDYKAYASSLVDKLKLIGIPQDSIINLESCFSGCTKKKLELSIYTIKGLFVTKKLTQLPGNIKGSLLDVLSKKIFEKMPTFTGNVNGYMGKMSNMPSRNILKIDGTYLLSGYASLLTGIDGDLRVKKSDVKISISRSDLGSLN